MMIIKITVTITLTEIISIIKNLYKDHLRLRHLLDSLKKIILDPGRNSNKNECQILAEINSFGLKLFLLSPKSHRLLQDRLGKDPNNHANKPCFIAVELLQIQGLIH